MSVAGNDDFVSGRGRESRLHQSGEEVAIEAVGDDISVRYPFLLNGPSDIRLYGQCRFCWLNCVESIHIHSKLRWKKSLHPSYSKLSNPSFSIIIFFLHSLISNISISYLIILFFSFLNSHLCNSHQIII